MTQAEALQTITYLSEHFDENKLAALVLVARQLKFNDLKIVSEGSITYIDDKLLIVPKTVYA